MPREGAERPIKKRKLNKDGGHIGTVFDTNQSNKLQQGTSHISVRADTAMRWEELIDLPESKLNPVVINDTEYILVTGKDTVRAYDSLQNKWRPFLHLSSYLPRYPGAIAYDKDSQLLYVSSSENQHVVAVDIRTGTTRTLINFVWMKNLYQMVAVSGARSGDIHVFDDCHALASHMILKKSNKYRNGFEDIRLISDIMTTIDAVIYSEERHSIIVFGGYWCTADECIDECHCECKHSEDKTVPMIYEHPLGYLDVIHEKEQRQGEQHDGKIPEGYSWKRLEFEECKGQGHSEVAAVCVKNGRYLITFGGRAHPETDEEIKEIQDLYNEGCWWGLYTDAIVVYDMNDTDSKPIISSIRCPIKAAFHALVLRNKRREEVITFGFINRLYRSEFKGISLLPVYLMQLIAKWVEKEAVHLLQKEGNGHWKMNLDHILESVS